MGRSLRPRYTRDMPRGPLRPLCGAMLPFPALECCNATGTTVCEELHRVRTNDTAQLMSKAL